MSIKILVVDDEPDLAPLIKQIFRKEIRQKKYAFIFASDGLAALEILYDNLDIDIILTDIKMPKMNGLELLAKLQELKNTVNPVLTTTVIISAYDDIENIRAAMNNGAFDFLTKPIDHKDLRVTLDRTIEHAQQMKKILEEKKSAQKALQSMNEELEERVENRTAELMNVNADLVASNTELDAFARTVAHDIKNLLSIIIGYTSYAIEYFSEIDAEELLNVQRKIMRNGQKTVTVINELLLLSGIRKDVVLFTSLDMADIVEQAQQRLILIKAEHKGAVIVLPDVWPEAIGYAPWIEEVWFNYLSNGLKYGGQPPRLELGATPQPDGMIRFWIRDNGEGIDPEAQQFLFTEFTRLDKVDVKGYGLGLSIVQRIINKMKGEVGVESSGTDGEGSIFYFTLPKAISPTNIEI